MWKLGLLIAFVGASVGVGVVLDRRRDGIMQRLADKVQGRLQKKGNAWNPKGFYLEGLFRNYGVSLTIDIVREHKYGRRRYSYHDFTFVLRQPESFSRLRITSKGIVSNLANMAGVPTGQNIGRPEFDQHFNLYGNPQELSRYLVPGLDKHLHKLFSYKVKELVLDGTTIKVGVRDLIYNVETFTGIFEAMAYLAKAHERRETPQQKPAIQVSARPRRV